MLTMNMREKPRIVSSVKKKKNVQLNPEHLIPVRQEAKPLHNDVKQHGTGLPEND